jgi:IS1 family transposase
MELTVALVVIGVLLLLGFVIGTRVEEHNLEARERELARARRELTQAARSLRVRKF